MFSQQKSARTTLKHCRHLVFNFVVMIFYAEHPPNPQFQGLKIDLCSYRRPNYFFRSAPVVRIAKTNTILKRAGNKLFAVENTYDTKQTDKVSYKEIASPFPCCSVNREYS